MSNPVLHAVIGNSVYVARNAVIHPGEGDQCFSTSLHYHPVGNDFGPTSMSSIIGFIEQLDNKLASQPGQKLYYIVGPGRRLLTNAVFLLGAYMIVKLDIDASSISKITKAISKHLEPYRDASSTNSGFELTLEDCWFSLQRSKALGWLNMPRSVGGRWGRVDPEEYDHYRSVLNANLTEVVPGRLIVLKSPRDVGGRKYLNNERGVRHFSASYMAEILTDCEASAVVRLGDEDYDTDAFERRGLLHHDLHAYFDANGLPSPHAAVAFLAAVDSAAAADEGPVAAHCSSGLERAPTLAAMYLIRRLSFPAREAIAWVRIMRPGSIVGPQQHYLAALDPLAPTPKPAAARTPRVEIGEESSESYKSSAGATAATAAAKPASISAAKSVSLSNFSSSPRASASARAIMRNPSAPGHGPASPSSTPTSSFSGGASPGPAGPAHPSPLNSARFIIRAGLAAASAAPAGGRRGAASESPEFGVPAGPAGPVRPVRAAGTFVGRWS
jgi:cell division cycle 14